MLDQAMAWARRTFDTYIVNEPDGSVRDRYAYPLAAFRELIANALIHRDLNPGPPGSPSRSGFDATVSSSATPADFTALPSTASAGTPSRLRATPAWSPSASTSTPQRPVLAPSRHSPAESPS
jgi:hypothetical protein